MVISVFRYVYIFHWASVLSDTQKKSMEKKCLLYLFGTSIFTSVFGLIYCGSTKRYIRCMGRAEEYFFNIPFFLEDPVGGHLTILPIYHPFRLALIFLYCIYLFIVPFAYIRIYRFRKKCHENGKDKSYQKKRNIVSFGYNMAVWLAEGVAMTFVSIVYVD